MADLRTWMEELAQIMNGEYDEEGNLLVDPGDGLYNSYAGKEIYQMFKTNMSPREVADLLLQGAAP